MHIRSIDLRHVMLLAITRLDLNPPRLADDVFVRRDQAIFGNDETGAEAFLLTVSAREADHDDRRFQFGDEFGRRPFFRRSFLRCGGLFGFGIGSSRDERAAKHQRTE